MEHLSSGPNPPNLRLFTDPRQAKLVWEIRESALGVTSQVPGEPLLWEGWEDAAVAPEKLGGYLRELRKLLNAFDYKASSTALRPRMRPQPHQLRPGNRSPGSPSSRKFMEEAADLVVSFGGSLSGEHGDGQARAELLPKMFGPELMQAFREFKSAWDPAWRMNPGKVIESYRIDENLRLGTGFTPWQPQTHFKFPEDHGSLSHAALRCVGWASAAAKKAA